MDATRPSHGVERAGQRRRVWARLGQLAETVVGPADEGSQQQDVIRRGLIAPAVVAIAALARVYDLAEWQAVVLFAGAAFLYDIPLAYLVFARKRFFVARILAFVLDAGLLFVASLYVLRALGESNSTSDFWLGFLVFIVSGGFVLAPIGALIYAAVAIGSFVLGTLLYFEAGSVYREQLVVRVAFFAVFGLMSLGIAQELQKRRQKLIEQNRELIDSRQQLQRSLDEERERARRDPLTGALNHAAIMDSLREHIDAHTKPLVVAMADVDILKSINDTFGHQMGDTVLVTVASALARDGALVGRYGGDEFVALLPGVDRAGAEVYRRGVLDALAATELFDHETSARITVAASIGLASFPEEAGSIEDLIRLSDSAMYASRRSRVVRVGTGRPEEDAVRSRAAAIVGEIVPLLTAPGTLTSKLDLVTERVAMATGYDVITVRIGPRDKPPFAWSAYGRVPRHLVEAWFDQQGSRFSPDLFDSTNRTRRPMIFDDVQGDSRVSDEGRGLLEAVGIKSALVVPMAREDEFIGTLSAGSAKAQAFGPRDAQLLTAVAGQVTAIVHLTTLVAELEVAQTETVLLLAAAAEAHDRATGLHLLGIRAITEALAREFGHSDEDAHTLGLAAVLHDIGKIRVPDAILSTPGQLSDDEWDLMKKHTIWGAEFLAGRPGFDMARGIARSHHERWDGTGYPEGLAGEEISEPAAIVAVADSFDAMTNDRPYRTGRGIDQAVREIEIAAGTQFSPNVVAALVRLHTRGDLYALKSRIVDSEAA